MTFKTMRMRSLVALLALALNLALNMGCVNRSSFECSQSSACGAGVCEPSGFCSFTDEDCISGRRYGEFAGQTLSLECVDPLAVLTARAEISPNNVFVGSESIAFVYDLAIEVGPRNSGVDVLRIELPGNFSGATLGQLLVDGSPRAYSDQSAGGVLEIRLADKLRSSAALQLHFETEVPSRADIVGQDFVATVDDSETKEAGQLVNEGNADGDPGDANRWSVTVSDGLPAVSSARAEISPRDVAIASIATLFQYQIEIEVQGQDSGIDHLAIDIPSGFSAPAVQGVFVDDSQVGAAASYSAAGIELSLDAPVLSSATLRVEFLADGGAEEDTLGVEFRSRVFDSAMPLVVATETVPKTSESWSVTTTSWPALTSALGEISPEGAEALVPTVFRYDLQLEVGARSTGFDALSFSFPPHLAPSAIQSVQLNDQPLSSNNSLLGSEATVLLEQRVEATGHLSVDFLAELVACSGGEEGEVLAVVDDSSSVYPAQEVLAGNADGDADDANSISVASEGQRRLLWCDVGAEALQGGTEDSCSIDELIGSVSDPRFVALDPATGRVYLADADEGQILSVDLGGGSPSVVVTGLSQASGLAIDAVGAKLYWSDTGTDKIQRSNLDGSAPEDVLLRGPAPYGIALDVPSGKLYWSDRTSGQILRANLDGSAIETLMNGLSQPAGVLVVGGALYVSEEGANRILRANLDGSGSATFLSGQSAPAGLAYDALEDRLYWSERGAGRIRSSDATGGDILDHFSGLSEPLGLALEP